MDRYLTLAGRGVAADRIRGSAFVAVAAPAAEEAAARDVLAAVEREHFSATHNCSAWRLRGGIWRANDAGEPSGSAGAPILAAIDGAGVVDCVVVVTRYFGGTKLGVGGLIRAYGDLAAVALQAAPRRVGVPALRARVRYPYEHTSAVMRVLERVEATEVEHGYADGGREGLVTFALPGAAGSVLHEQLREQTAGAIAPEILGESVLFLPAES